MKKALVIILSAVLCFYFAACSKQQKKEEATQPATTTAAATTTTESETSTTAPARKDEQKGASLKATVCEALGNQDTAEIDGNLEYGSFTYKFNRDPKTVYANEQSEKLETKAKNNAQKLVDKIQGFYGDEITFDREYAAPIGSGDNGIDSVQYQFFYLNSQNQQLKIFADSDGTISYAECNFTW